MWRVGTVPNVEVEPPTLDEYFGSARKLADLVRMAYDKPGSVKRGALKSALEKFEAADAAARGH